LIKVGKGSGISAIVICLEFGIYFVAENLVLWARSETIGSAENICHGMMEYWNDGMLGLVEWDLYFIRMARISF